MPRILNMPELAESVVEGEIVQWLVAQGDAVAEDQPLVEVMTDKVTVEIPSPFAGVLAEHLASEGDVVPVGGPIARFEEAGDGAAAGAAGGAGAQPDAQSDTEAEAAAAGGTAEPMAPVAAEESAGAAAADAADAADGPADPDDGSSLTLFTAGPDVDEGQLPRVTKPSRDGGGRPSGAGAAAAPGRGAAPGAGPAAGADADAGTTAGAAAPIAAAPTAPRGPWGRPLAVPAARKLARELGVPLDRIDGSGPHGRIRVRDVRVHGQAGTDASAAAAAPADTADATDRQLPPYAGAPLLAAPEGPEESRQPLRGLRRVIAKQMVASHRDTVRTLHVDEADMTRLVALRGRLKPRAAARGVSLSYLPFVMKAVTRALAAFPMLNASLDDAAGEIVRYRDVHLGLAVATERGLLVPVIRDASRRTVLDLAAQASRLAAAARDGSLTADEARGGTFSVTNIGSIGGLFSFPIINAPEAAILGVHSIKKRPVVLDDDTIAARSMLYLSLSFDHRLVDGAEAALFTRHLIDLLEDPGAMLLDA